MARLVYSKFHLNLHVSTNELDVKLTPKVKLVVIGKMTQGAPEAIRMDNGPEMTSETFTEWAKEKGIALLFIQPGKPNQNAFVERFNRSFRDEVLDANLFNSIAEAQEAAEIWVMDYNEFRPHDSLGDKTPMEFMPRTFN